MKYYTELDLVITPLYFLLILIVAHFIYLKNKHNPLYRFFFPGLMVKLFGALALCFVYTHYYGYGGDTIGYHQAASAMVNLFSKNFSDFIYVWLGENTPEGYLLFDSNTGYPLYWNDKHAFNTARFIVPFEILTLKSFPATALFTATIAFSGLWQLFILFCEMYPKLYKQFAVSVLFVPSVIFWGSGILKDTFTITGVCWYCYSFFRIVIQRNFNPYYIVAILVSVILLISIKPYAFVALLPGSILWGISGLVKQIKNILLKILLGPFILLLGSGIGMAIWLVVSPGLDRYSSLDSMIDKAHEAQQDLKREYYEGNSFDIGEFEKTPTGVLSKFPEATLAGLFRPFIWEANNIQMVIAGLENLFILCFTLFFLIRVPISFFKQIVENPLVMFCVVFSVIFAFSVGLSTANFGAMVRFKIAFWPFYLSALFIINYHRIKYKVANKDQFLN